VDPKIIRHYDTTDEAGRLSEGTSRVEFERTKEILLRYLPDPPAWILDIGGGPGAYSFWLARSSYRVHLIDAVPRHVDQASDHEDAALLSSIEIGDARDLNFESRSMDAVLLLGPLYHLPDRSHRIQVLREAHRVLKDGGLIFCAAISRFASLLDGLKKGYLADPRFRQIAHKDLQDGSHLNPDECPGYFTTAYFHLPEELKEEVNEAGFTDSTIFGLEGPAWILGDFDEQWADPERRDIMMETLRLIEQEPALMGVSAHLLAVGKKADGNMGTT
jgi:ubiquinone/menaquinone biosynthesis C-methylase UbiE